MKNKKQPTADLETIIPILIHIWRRFRQLSGPPDKLQTREFQSVVAKVKELQAGLDDGNGLHGTEYFKDPEMLGAYLLYNWIVHYQQGLSLINELPEAPRKVLDLCSGPGAFAFAALRHGASHVVAIDRSAQALELGALIAGRYGLPLTPRQHDCKMVNLQPMGSFDLIIMGHCLHELFPEGYKNWNKQQLEFVKNLFHSLTPNGCLLMVENSYVASNRRLLQIRDQLVAEGIPIQAPCIWKGACPALAAANSPCYAQRELEKPFLVKEIQRAANINLSSLKMSYMIFRNPVSGWPKLPEKPLYRIISPGIESYQGVRYYLCGSEGKKKLGSHLKQHPVESRAFEFIRRGELISIENAMEKDNSIDIVEGTKIRVEAACSKPIPELGDDEEKN